MKKRLRGSNVQFRFGNQTLILIAGNYGGALSSFRLSRRCSTCCYKPPQSLHQTTSVPLRGPAMTILSDHNRYPGFLQSGQLTLFCAAIIVLLIFAWSYAH